MKKVFFLLFSLILLIAFSRNAYAFKEDYGFIILDVPFGWTVIDKKEFEVTLTNPNKDARFIYKVLPVHNVDLKTYAEAIMQAYMGFNFKLVSYETYAFNYLYLNKLATMRIHFNGRVACLQTRVGKSEDFFSLLDSAQLQKLPDSFFINPVVELPEKED